jgi:hypothetical protein
MDSLNYIDNKKWNSLTQLKEWLETNTKEKIKSFDGIYLKSNKYEYTLALGKVKWKSLK